MEHAAVPATWRAYAGRWRRFEAWCAGVGERALPAGPATVARFLTDLAPRWRPAQPGDPPADVVAGHVLARAGLRPSSIAGCVAAISVAHQVAGAPSPTGHPSVRAVLAGIRRHPTVATARRRAALRPAEVAAMLAAMRLRERLADARDAAVLLIGWKAALRTDELGRLAIADVVVGEEGLSVHVRRSKTDQLAAGAVIGIAASPPGDPLDAVAAWLQWRERLAGHGFHAGPAWRPIDRYGRRPRPTGMSTKALSAVIGRRTTAAGLAGDYGGIRCGAGSPPPRWPPGPRSGRCSATASGPRRRRWLPMWTRRSGSPSPIPPGTLRL